jgi:hypothetical protein
MRKFIQKLLLLVAAILAVDLIVPGVSSGEVALQAGLVGIFGAVTYFRR